MSNFRNYIPQITSVLFISIIIGAFGYKLATYQSTPSLPLFIAFILLYLIWLASEFKVARSEVKKGENTSDFGTCEVYALGRALTLISGISLYPQFDEITIYHLVGLILFVFGFSFRLYAISTLGKYYSHIVRKVEGHKIITQGPYGFIRHPAYTGMILANFGVMLFFLNYFTVIVFLFILLPSIIMRIAIEEKMLFNIEGYRDYAKNRKRLIPFVW